MDMVGVSIYSSHLIILTYRMYFHKFSIQELKKTREKWLEW